MSRAALPPVPPVEGTPATYDETTFARTWEERRETWVEQSHPQPVQRAIDVSVDDPRLPQNARKIARKATAAGFTVKVTHAIGYAFNPKTGEIKMKNVMELTGGMTAGTDKTPPRPARKKVGEVPSEPVDSIRVVVRTPGALLAGHWVDGGWESGVILTGHTLVRNVDWTRLERAFNAESQAHLCGETAAGGWTADQLPLNGDARQPL